MRRRNRKRIEITPKYFLLALTIVCVVLMIASLFFDSIMPSVRKATNTFILPMQKGVNTVEVTSYKKTSVTVKSLKSKKNYYFRIRTINSKSASLVSGWSKAKKLKIK